MATSRQAMEFERRWFLTTKQKIMLWQTEATRYQVLSTIYLENLCLYQLETPRGKEKTGRQRKQSGEEVNFGRFQHTRF